MAYQYVSIIKSWQTAAAYHGTQAQFLYTYQLLQQLSKHEIIYHNRDWTAASDVQAGDFIVFRPLNAGSNPAGQNWTAVVAYGNDATISNIATATPASDHVWLKMTCGDFWDTTNNQFYTDKIESPWAWFPPLSTAGTDDYVSSIDVWEFPGAIVYSHVRNGTRYGVFYMGAFDALGSPDSPCEPIIITGGDTDAYVYYGGPALDDWGTYDGYIPNAACDGWIAVRLSDINASDTYTIEEAHNTYYEGSGSGKPFARPISIFLSSDDTRLVGFLPTLYNSQGQYEGIFDVRYLSDVATDGEARAVFCGVSLPWS